MLPLPETHVVREVEVGGRIYQTDTCVDKCVWFARGWLKPQVWNDIGSGTANK